jgi:hypothetical protein
VLVFGHAQTRLSDHFGFAHPILRRYPLQLTDAPEPPNLGDVQPLGGFPPPIEAEFGKAAAIENPRRTGTRQFRLRENAATDAQRNARVPPFLTSAVRP